MDNQQPSWQDRFELAGCPAADAASAIPAKAPGIAVVYATANDDDTIFLVLESRAGSLRDLCVKRLLTAKIPANTPLLIAYKSMPPAGDSPEAVSAACREQVILAGALRRELRPAMR
jgi:hypothetical protein